MDIVTVGISGPQLGTDRRLNIEVRKGADFAVELVLKDRQSQPVDLTGKTFSMDINRSVALNSPLIVSATVSINDADPTDGVISAKIGAADTGKVFERYGHYRLSDTTDGGNVLVSKGRVVFIEGNE